MAGSLNRRGGVLVPLGLLTVILVGGSAIFVAGIDSKSAGTGNAHDALSANRKLNDPVAAERLLLRLGLTPEVFAAAGVMPEQYQGILTSMPTVAPMNDRMELLSQATRALNQASERVVRRPVPGDEALTTFAQARAALDAILDQAFNDSVNSLPPDTIARLRTMRVNSKKVNVPAYYLVADWPDERWLALRDALSAQRIAAGRNATLNAQSASVISQADGEPSVATAKTVYDTHLAQFQEQWRTRLVAPPQP